MATFETASGAIVPGTGHTDAGQPTPSGLRDVERAMLEFEREWWKLPGSKEAAAKQKFGLSPTQYYQMLNKLIDKPEAMAIDPMVVKRLQRRRAQRRRQG